MPDDSGDRGGAREEPKTLHARAKEVVDLLGLGSVLIFITSAALNSLVFAMWQVSYLQVATASDVFLGVVQIGVLAAIMPLGVIVGYSLALRSKWLFWVWAVLAIASVGIGFFADRLFTPYANLAFAMVGLVVPILVALIAGHYVVHEKGLWRIQAILNAGALLIFGIFLLPIIMLGENGYMPTPSFTVSENQRCQVMWRGSENAVLRCNDGRVAVVPSEGLVIEIGEVPIFARPTD